jgi:hypothetical protein
LINSDVEFLRSFYCDEFVACNCLGIIKNKAEELARIRFGEVKYLAWEDKRVSIEICGAKAVVKSLQTVQAEVYQFPIKIDREVLLSFEKSNERWFLKKITEKQIK